MFPRGRPGRGATDGANRGRPRRLRRLLAFGAVGALAAAFITAGVVLLVVAARGDDGPRALPRFEQALVLPSSTATAEPTATPDIAQSINRVQIPRIAVNAPTVILGVDAQGTMLSPKNPMDIAWYTFSAKPGEKGNVVLSGHVDYVNFGPAVFWRLRELRPGDDVLLEVDGGRVFAYRVLAVATYDADTAPVQEIVGPTETEILTLITCTGAFDARNLEYADRLVVRAERVF